MNYLATSNNTYIKTKDVKTPYGDLTNLNSAIVYVKQTLNEDGTCNLILTEEGHGQKYVLAQLDNGDLVLTNIGG